MTASPQVPPPIVVARPSARYGGLYRWLLVASGLVLFSLIFVGDFADWRERGVVELPEVAPFALGIVVAACGCVVGRRSLGAAFAIARTCAWLVVLGGLIAIAKSLALAAMVLGVGGWMLVIMGVRGRDERRLATAVVVIGAVYTGVLGLIALFDRGATYDLAAAAALGTLIGGSIWRGDVVGPRSPRGVR
jgi:hypothetical protein